MLTNLATRDKNDEERIMHRIVVTLQIYICDDEDDHYDFSHDEFQRNRIQYKDENYIMFRD